MALLKQTKLVLAVVTLAVFLSLSSSGEGVKQEMWWYTESGTALYFQSNEPDLTGFSSILPKITRYCMVGVWGVFNYVNYQNDTTLTSDPRGILYCDTFNATEVHSVRHFGANDTSTDAISLYAGGWYSGEEIFVTENARTDIPIAIGSLAATGTSDWMLHEGKHLDGRSVCYKVPRVAGTVISYDWVSLSIVNLTTIGSVYKGCDEREIQMYKDAHFM